MQGTHRVAWFSLRFPQYNNRRYAELVPRLTSVAPWEIRFHRNALLWRAEFRLYVHLAKRVVDPLVLRRLARSYRYLFVTMDWHHIDQFGGPVVVDVDDPDFVPASIAAFNQAQVRAVVTTTEHLRQRMLQAGVSRPILVMPQGVDLSAIDAARVANICAQYRRPGDLVIGVSAPDLYRDADCRTDPGCRMHNVELALQAVECLREQAPRARLWLFGRPSKALVEYARQAGYVRLFGFLKPSELLNHIACCDIAIYPRELDFGGRASIKLMEYMGCGVPIAATDVAESFVVRDAEAGLVATGADGLAGALQELAASEELRARCAANGRRYAARHDWGIIAERYEREVFDVYCP